MLNISPNISLNSDLKQEIEQKQDWSEDDEQYLLVCKNALAKYQTTDKWDANIIFLWLENKLKFLRDRYTWKPSDEQMKALSIAIRCGIQLGTWEEYALKSLKSQLKRLKDKYDGRRAIRNTSKG